MTARHKFADQDESRAVITNGKWYLGCIKEMNQYFVELIGEQGDELKIEFILEQNFFRTNIIKKLEEPLKWIEIKQKYPNHKIISIWNQGYPSGILWDLEILDCKLFSKKASFSQNLALAPPETTERFFEAHMDKSKSKQIFEIIFPEFTDLLFTFNYQCATIVGIVKELEKLSSNLKQNINNNGLKIENEESIPIQIIQKTMKLINQNSIKAGWKIANDSLEMTKFDEHLRNVSDSKSSTPQRLCFIISPFFIELTFGKLFDLFNIDELAKRLAMSENLVIVDCYKTNYFPTKQHFERLIRQIFKGAMFRYIILEYPRSSPFIPPIVPFLDV